MTPHCSADEPAPELADLEFVGRATDFITLFGELLADEFAKIEMEYGETFLSRVEADEVMRHLGLAQVHLREFLLHYNRED